MISKKAIVMAFHPYSTAQRGVGKHSMSKPRTSVLDSVLFISWRSAMLRNAIDRVKTISFSFKTNKRAKRAEQDAVRIINEYCDKYKING